jgi:hypothetical protein
MQKVKSFLLDLADMQTRSHAQICMYDTKRRFLGKAGACCKPCLDHPTLRRLHHDQVQASGQTPQPTNREQRLAVGWYGDIYSNHPAAARIDQVRRRCLLAEDDGRNQHGISSISMHITDTSASASYSGISSTDIIHLPTPHFDSSFLLPSSFLSLSSPTALARVLRGLPRHRDYSKDHRHHCTSLLSFLPPLAPHLFCQRFRWLYSGARPT